MSSNLWPMKKWPIGSHTEKTKSANTKHEFYVKFPHTGKSQGSKKLKKNNSIFKTHIHSQFYIAEIFQVNALKLYADVKGNRERVCQADVHC